MAHFDRYSDVDNSSRQDLNSDYYSPNQAPPQNQPYSDSAWGNNVYPPSPRGSSDPINQPAHSFATPYTPVGMSYKDEPQTGPMWSQSPKTGNKRKWLIIGGIVAVIVIAVAVGVGVAVSHHHSSSSASSSSSSSDTNGGSSGNGSSGGTSNPTNTKGWVTTVNGVVKYNPHDLSQFETDPRLFPSLYGMAYTPLGAILPECGASFDQILEDVYLMSQLTTRIRLYGTDCNATELVMDAIQQTKTDLSVYIGIYIDTANDTTYQRQKADTLHILQTYDINHVLGITVGNEVILDNLTDLNQQNAASPAGISIAEYLITKIQDVRTMLASLKLSKTIPVGNGDAGAYTNVQLLGAVDYFMSNIHPWFGGLPVDQAAGWTWEFFEENNVALAANLSNKPDLMIAEVGWPSNSTTAVAATDGPSMANEPTLNTFLNDFVCTSNTNGTKYFWFETMDQPWKTALYGGVEGYWGLFDATKHLKNITIPNCKATQP